MLTTIYFGFLEIEYYYYHHQSSVYGENSTVDPLNWFCSPVLYEVDPTDTVSRTTGLTSKTALPTNEPTTTTNPPSRLRNSR